MKTNFVQIEIVNGVDYKKEILDGVRNIVETHVKKSESKPFPDYITRKEASALLGVSLVTISDWTSKKILKAYRIGNRVRFKRSEIEETLENSTTQ